MDRETTGRTRQHPNHGSQRLRRLTSSAASLAILLAWTWMTSPAAAQALQYKGWGLRGGFSLTPDQFVVGAHVHLGELAPSLRLDPNVDIGFGDHLTVFTLNPDIIYVVPVRDAGKFYIGLVYTRWDSGSTDVVDGHEVKLHDNETDLGVALVGGYEFPGAGAPLALDLKVGLSDHYPDVKLMLCYTFPR